jgi:FkbM family methyltransferase
VDADLTISDKLLAYPRAVLDNFSIVRGAIKNWYALPLLYLRMAKKVSLSTSTGKKVSISSWGEFMDYWNSTENIKELIGHRAKFSIRRGEVVVNYRGRCLCFMFPNTNVLQRILFEVYGHFVKGEYDELEVRGRNVIDVGAGLGETPLYFLARGASHVYAFEPFPMAYEMARKNMARSGLARRVTLLNKGCGGESGSIKISAKKKSTPASTLRASRSGRKVKITTLAEILKDYRIRNAVLKLDCEGCEYGMLLGASDETLARLSQIILEYHHGHRRLAERLRRAGFNVRVEAPRYHVSYAERKKLYMGKLFAYR